MLKSVTSFRHLVLVPVFWGQDGVDGGGSLLFRDFAVRRDGGLVCEDAKVRESSELLSLLGFEELSVRMAGFVLNDMSADGFKSA